MSTSNHLFNCLITATAAALNVATNNTSENQTNRLSGENLESYFIGKSYATCLIIFIHMQYNKAELLQRWPRDAPYIMSALKIFGSPWLCQSLLFPKFLMGFSSDWCYVHTKFEVHSFTRSWDNRGYPKNLGSPWICPRSPVWSKIFHMFLR